MKKIISLIMITFIGALLVSGFQCSSKEMSSAKVKIQTGDYAAAKTFLEKELKAHSENQEAWIMLAEVKYKLKDVKGAAETLKKAEKIVVDPKLKDRVPRFMNEIWVKTRNAAVKLYQAYATAKNEKNLDKALEQLEIATLLRPERSDFYYLSGLIYQAKKNEGMAIQQYEKFYSLMKPNYDLSTQDGIFVGMNKRKAVEKLGKPIDTKGFLSTGVDSLITDIFNYQGSKIYMYSSSKAGSDFFVRGWKVDPPENWPDFEKTDDWSNLESTPLVDLAQIYSDKKDYEKALEYATILSSLEPTNSVYNAFKVEMYKKLDRTDEAIAQVKALAEIFPNNKNYWAQYGDIMLTMKNYDNAISAYDKALKIDPKFDLVLRNIATAYKNKAGIIQAAQSKKMDEDKNYKPVTDEYFPLLKKSGEYFESCRKSKEFKHDLEVLGELVNIYEVLGDTDKIKIYLGELEQLENTTDDKANYYRIMTKVYQILRMPEKEKESAVKYGKYLDLE